MKTLSCQAPLSSTWTGRLWIFMRSRGRRLRSSWPRCELRTGSKPDRQRRRQSSCLPVRGEQRSTAKNWKIGAAIVSRPSICRLGVPSRQSPTYCDARDAGLRIAIAASAKKEELEKYLEIAHITELVDVTTSSDDAEESKSAHCSSGGGTEIPPGLRRSLTTGVPGQAGWAPASEPTR